MGCRNENDESGAMTCKTVGKEKKRDKVIEGKN